MPIYEYTCRKCKAHVEVMQKISDKPLSRHAKCGGRLEKEWSRTGVQFKGTGWYVTDYAGQKSDAQEGKEDAPAAKGESSAEATKETATTKETAKADAQKSKGKKKGKDSAASA